MKKVPEGATVADLIGYSLKSLKPVPMYDGLLNQINTLPADRYSPPIESWVTIGGKVYLAFENPSSYPKSIYMPMTGGYWNGYIYNLGVKPPASTTTPGATVSPLKIAAMAAAGLIAVLIFK